MAARVVSVFYFTFVNVSLFFSYLTSVTPITYLKYSNLTSTLAPGAGRASSLRLSLFRETEIEKTGKFFDVFFEIKRKSTAHCLIKMWTGNLTCWQELKQVENVVKHEI